MTLLFSVKHVIGSLASPLTLAFLLAIVGGVLGFAKRPRPGRSLLICAAAVSYLGSISAVGDALLRPLEWQYSPLPVDHPLPAVNYIVVLGSGYRPGGAISVAAALDPDGLTRVVDGILLSRRLASARLILSGGAPSDSKPSALGYAALARQFGVAQDSLIILDTPLDTIAEGRAIFALIGKNPFILVTSAYHMPRAVRDMQLAGAQPIPAPTGQLTTPRARLSFGSWLPNAGGLSRSERALHEYLGFAELALKIE